MSRPTLPEWLVPHRGLSTDVPQTIETTTPEGVAVAGDFTAVEGLGCAVRGLRISPPQPLPSDLDDLRRRADNLTDALPGGMTFQEADSCQPAILLRTPPRRDDGTVAYEEAVVAPSGVTIQRVEFDRSEGRRTADLPVTWEQFGKIVDSATKTVAPAAD